MGVPEIADNGATDEAVLRDLLHVKALFQLRAITAVLGFPTIDADSDPGSWADALLFECPSRTVHHNPIRNVPEEDGGSQPARGAPTAPLSPAGCLFGEIHDSEVGHD